MMQTSLVCGSLEDPILVPVLVGGTARDRAWWRWRTGTYDGDILAHCCPLRHTLSAAAFPPSPFPGIQEAGKGQPVEGYWQGGERVVCRFGCREILSQPRDWSFQ